jgi:glycosyltransferase involved in cell wall biosynthesis
MKILFVVERPTQFEVPLYRLAAADPQHELCVVFTAPGAGEPPWDPELGRRIDWGFDLLSGYRSVERPAAAGSGWWRQLLRAERPRLVIVNGYTRGPYLAAAWAARGARVRCALRIDSALFPGGRPSHRWLRRLLLRRFLPLLFPLDLTVGTLGRRYLEALGVEPARIGSFPYPVDVDGFAGAASRARTDGSAGRLRARLGIPESARVVASLSKHGPREAPGDLLAAAERLLGPGGSQAASGGGSQELWFVLAGDGPERPALEAAARSRGLDRVLFPGYMPYAELPTFYAAIDVFVHPAHEERWGVSVAEALACGLPVVASSHVGAAYDLIAEGHNGSLFPRGAAVALANACSAALALPAAEVRRASAERLEHVHPRAVWAGLVAVAEERA